VGFFVGDDQDIVFEKASLWRKAVHL